MKKNNKRKVYSRRLIRKILKNQLKTNEIKNAFHDEKWLKTFLKAL